MIDLHCHVLPGVDDGPATMEDSLELARVQANLGVTTIVATPHVSWDYPGQTAARIAEDVAAVNEAFRAEGIPVTVLPGAEVALTRAIELPDEELEALRLGGGPWLLVEPPFGPGGVGMENSFISLLHRGHRIVVAHPERAAGFLGDRPALERLVASGALCSITAGALSGRFGRSAKSFAAGLIDEGLAHNVASDAHAASGGRAPGMIEDVTTAGYPADLGDWLCRAVPEAIVGGAPLPERPAVAAPRSGRGGLARLFRRA